MCAVAHTNGKETVEAAWTPAQHLFCCLDASTATHRMGKAVVSPPSGGLHAEHKLACMHSMHLQVCFKLDPTMFSNAEKQQLPMERCMRILPHQQVG
jgi:hypothetical protein